MTFLCWLSPLGRIADTMISAWGAFDLIVEIATVRWSLNSVDDCKYSMSLVPRCTRIFFAFGMWILFMISGIFCNVGHRIFAMADGNLFGEI